MNNHLVAIVPAAGIGSRMNSAIPKQYISLHGQSILSHTLNKLANVEQISAIYVALSPSDEYFNTLNINHSQIKTVEGGETRAQSVLNALNALKATPPIWVLVHDAARPLVEIKDINTLLEACFSQNQGGILAAKVRDTIKQGAKLVETTIPREQLWQALTPQVFKYNELLNALTDALNAEVNITDEASAMEWANQPVQLIAGRSDNIKITTPEDIQLANFLLAQQLTESA